MTSRRSSGSRRAESSVEPTRSQNITVSCRRSASARTGASGGRGGWDLGAECGNRGEQSAPVPDEGDAEVPQVVGGQLRQHRGVDRVVAKPRFVLLQAETVEPGCDVHPRLPAAVTCRAALTLQEDYRSRARNERGWSPSSHAPIAAFVDWLVAEAAVIGL